jgi:hypothetical protein
MRRLLLLPFVLLACETPPDAPPSCDPEPVSCSSDAACPAGQGCDGTVYRPWCVRVVTAECLMPRCKRPNREDFMPYECDDGMTLIRGPACLDAGALAEVVLDVRALPADDAAPLVGARAWWPLERGFDPCVLWGAGEHDWPFAFFSFR